MSDNGTDEHVKTVYAHFGLALYLAQVLEHGLVNAMMCVELLPRRAGRPIARKEWEAEFDTFMDQQFEQTLGRLIRGVKSTTSVPAELEGLLTGALKTRNFLTHHFFRERAGAFMSREGRNTMIQELEQAQKLFDAADVKLTEVIKPLREKYGLSDERMEPLEEAYLRGIKRDI